MLALNNRNLFVDGKKQIKESENDYSDDQGHIGQTKPPKKKHGGESSLGI